MRSEHSVAVVPWGALEWHGDHLPLGLDGLVAEAFAARLAEARDATLLPTLWLPITALPHSSSAPIPTAAVRAVFECTVDHLHALGAGVVCVVTGHYAQGHMIELTRAARDRCTHGCRTLFATPLEPLEDPTLLDHAARWETAQLMALRPDLVRLDRLPEGPVGARHGVLGADPRDASAEEGREVLDRACAAWGAWIDRATAAPPTDLVAFYEGRLSAYDEYIRRFGEGNWEEALGKWWAVRLAREEAGN